MLNIYELLKGQKAIKIPPNADRQIKKDKFTKIKQKVMK